MWHHFLSYIKYLFTAKSKYSIHSPFVYHLVTEVFGKELPDKQQTDLQAYRKALSLSDKTIAVRDFGAGSRMFKSELRPVKQIAKYAGISPKKAAILQKVIHHFKPEHILELGTSLGIASASMAIANPNATISTIEGCPQTAQIAQDYFKQFHFDNIQISVGEFSKQLPKLLEKSAFDLIYFDGNHQKEATLAYFESCLAYATKDSLFIFDDIHWSKGMEEAWESIRNHPQTKVCIDVYHLGLVFFREAQEAQNFTIKL